MSKVCQICGRGPRVGFSVSHAHNRNKRRWDINLQTVRVVVNGSPKRIRACTRCIQAGKIERPKFVLRERKKKVLEPAMAKVTTDVSEEGPESRFFSETSIVDVIFKPKKTKPQEVEVETEAAPDKTEAAVETPDPLIEIVETEIVNEDEIIIQEPEPPKKR